MADDGGLSRFQARMRAIPQAVREAVQPALDKGASELVASMRQIAPNEDGDLQASIRKEDGDHELSVKVAAGGAKTTKPVRSGADTSYDYALGQEYGTKKMPANPFFWPAFRLNRKRLANRIKRAIGKAVKDN